MDGMGKIHSVREDSGTLNYATTYSYYPNGLLHQVTQGTQTRSSWYDLAGQLTSSDNPESGTTTYRYDTYGNVKTRAAARG